LVAYPVLPLGKTSPDPSSGNPRLPRVDFIGYLRDLEKVVIRALADLGVPAGQVKGQTGVWVQPDVASRCKNCPPEFKKSLSKIASIGVKVDARGISRHGFALNVSPDMDYWAGIKACGLDNQNQISLQQILNEKPDFDGVVDALVHQFSQVFEFDIQLSEGVVQI